MGIYLLCWGFWTCDKCPYNTQNRQCPKQSNMLPVWCCCWSWSKRMVNTGSSIEYRECNTDDSNYDCTKKHSWSIFHRDKPLSAWISKLLYLIVELSDWSVNALLKAASRYENAVHDKNVTTMKAVRNSYPPWTFVTNKAPGKIKVPSGASSKRSKIPVRPEPLAESFLTESVLT